MPDPIDLAEIADKVREAKEWDVEEQVDYWLHAHAAFHKRGGFPLEMRLVMNPDYKRALSSDMLFLDRAEILMTEVDNYWDAIRAGFAKYCRQYYLGEKD